MDEKNSRMIVLDVGSSSARVFLAGFDGKRLEISEEGRFYHGSVLIPGHEYWDVLGIFRYIQEAVGRIQAQYPVESVSVDSWGTDLVALDRMGEPVTNGVCTRDHRFHGLKEQFFKKMSQEEIYRRTGIQFLDWNTLYLLYGITHSRPWLWPVIDSLLFVPDLFSYFLSGEKNTDYSIASTSQMMNPWTKNWDGLLLQQAGIPRETLSEIRMAHKLGSCLGQYGWRPLQVISGCSHDTAAAVAGVPLTGPDEMYIICGSWAMVGIESPIPIVNERAWKYRFTNEGGVDGSIRFLKNVMGMWLVQESRRQWMREGKNYSYQELAQMEAQCAPFEAAIDVDDERLIAAGDIPGIIRTLCVESGQIPPDTVGSVMRCITDSLALKFRVIKSRLEQCCGRKIKTIRLVAGGSQDAVLCQTVADATGCVVIAGPVEASVYGNASVQLIVNGRAASLKQTREMIRNSVPLSIYTPYGNEKLEETFGKQRMLFETVRD